MDKGRILQQIQQTAAENGGSPLGWRRFATVIREADCLGADGSYHALSVNQLGVFHLGVFHSEVLAGLWLRVKWLWQDPQPLLTSVLKEWA